MSVTRFLSLFLALALLVALCCIPAFAAQQYSYYFTYNPDFGMLTDLHGSSPSAGNYLYELTLSAGSESVSGSGVTSVVLIEEGGLLVPFSSIMFNFSVDNLSVSYLFNFLLAYDVAGMNILVDEDSKFNSFDISLRLTKIENPSFTDGVSDGLDGVIGWIQEVTSSLTTGSLLPLLGLMAVAICVTGVLFSVKFIRKTSWGH